MRIAISLSLICGAALVLGGSTARAYPDTEAQAKAREAVRQAMQQLQTARLSPVPGAGVAALAAGALTQADADALARAREAVRQRIQELQPAPAQPADSVAKVKPEPVKRSRPAPAMVAQPKPVKPAKPVAVAKPKREKPVKSVVATKVKPAKPAEPVAAPKKVGEPSVAVVPLEGPGSPLPVGKDARLAELLRRYKADQITPQEYHTERARILSEP